MSRTKKLPAPLRNLELSNPTFESDDLRFLTITTPSLRGRGDITVYAPPELRRQRSVPIVLLLHGAFGSHTGWAFHGGAHRTARRLIAQGKLPPVLIAMPSDGLWGEGSGYYNHSGFKFDHWILRDVPETLALAFRQANANSPLFIAGLSMGGWGALRLTAQHPSKITAASAHSAVLNRRDLSSRFQRPYRLPRTPSIDTPLAQLLTRAGKRLPPIRFDCGRSDFLLESNQRLHSDLESAGVPHVYEEFPGAHDWRYWAAHIEDTLRFFGEVLQRR